MSIFIRVLIPKGDIYWNVLEPKSLKAATLKDGTPDIVPEHCITTMTPNSIAFHKCEEHDIIYLGVPLEAL